MQLSKRHLPVVGLLGLIVIAATGGTIYYYQFLTPHPVSHAAPVHRLIFMTAIVFEEGGFTITNTAYLNQTAPPPLSAFSSSGGYNLTGVVKYQNYTSSPNDNKNIHANNGDTLTFYIYGENATHTSPLYSDHHSFSLDIMPAPVTVIDGQLGGNLSFKSWYTVTFKINSSGLYEFRCLVPCSMGHSQMYGNIIAA